MKYLTSVTFSAGLAILAMSGPHAQPLPLGEEPAKVLEKVDSNISRVQPAETPYERWFSKASEHMPTFQGMIIQDARTEPLHYWETFGVNGLYIKMADYQITDGWILEVPAGGQTREQRHMFEAGLYFFNGPGHVLIQQEGKQPEKVRFDRRSLFSIPLNVRYAIVNESDEPVRLLAVTSFPFIINSTNNEAFAFDNPFAFRDRYDAEEDFASRSEHVWKNHTVTNVVPDVLAFELDEYDRRGKGSTNMHWDMSGNTMLELHVSEIPPQTYKKAHRHSSDAFILLLSGDGYSTTWPGDRYEDRVTVHWQEGTIFVPPIYWYHQHLNPGSEPARYLAINAPNLVTNLGLRFENQIEQDPPWILEEFEAEVERRKSGEAK